jgi:hypothetical protein
MLTKIFTQSSSWKCKSLNEYLQILNQLFLLNNLYITYYLDNKILREPHIKS